MKVPASRLAQHPESATVARPARGLVGTTPATAAPAGHGRARGLQGTRSGHDFRRLRVLRAPDPPVERPVRGDVLETEAERVAEAVMHAAPARAGDSTDPLRTALESVRIHTGEGADRSCRLLHARAFTLGRDIAFRRGAYRPDTPQGRRLLAHELTHVAQQRRLGPRIQASPIETHFGTFNDDYYRTLRSGRVPIGLQMVLSFLPGERVDASKIALVQIARTVREGRPYFQQEGNETRRSRAISEAEAERTGSPTLATDEGFGIDRAPSHVNPLYVVGEGRGFSPHSTLAEGVSEGPVEPLSPEALERLRTRYPRITEGARFAGVGRHGSREGAEDQPVAARLADSPRSVPALDSEQLLETAALAIEGRQTGTYYGSVEWGWRIDSSGRFSQLPLTLKSEGAPSSTFLAAAQLWNRGESSEGRSNIPLPAPEVHVIREPSVALYEGPHDRILEITPLGHLLRGTRVEILAGTDLFNAHVRVVDSPAVEGYVPATGSDLPSSPGSAVATETLQVFEGPHDHLLEIPPIAILHPGQEFRVVNTDGFAARIAADSSALMNEVGYLANLDPGHADERPVPAERERRRR